MSVSGNENRRDFLAKSGQFALLTLAGGWVGGCASSRRAGKTYESMSSIRVGTSPGGIDLCVAEGKKIEATVRAAVEGFGGVEKFVRKGDRVVLSPNIAFARTPDQAACTHPEVLRAAVKLCEDAGASKITVVDYTLDNAGAAFEINGAAQAITGTKASLLSPDHEGQYDEVAMPTDSIHARKGIRLRIPREVLRADVFIPMPVVKDHEAAVVSLSMKKLMGCIWDRRAYHRNDLHACVAELADTLRPTLVIADATRALQTHGPKGPGQVSLPNQIVVGTMPASVDAYCCKYLTVKRVSPKEVKHLVLAAERGLGEIEVSKLKVKEKTA